jgi:hypothetical protein
MAVSKQKHNGGFKVKQVKKQILKRVKQEVKKVTLKTPIICSHTSTKGLRELFDAPEYGLFNEFFSSIISITDQKKFPYQAKGTVHI